MSPVVLVWLKIESIKNIEMIQKLTVAMVTIFATFLALEVILLSNDGKSRVLRILLTLDADFYFDGLYHKILSNNKCH